MTENGRAYRLGCNIPIISTATTVLLAVWFNASVANRAMWLNRGAL